MHAQNCIDIMANKKKRRRSSSGVCDSCNRSLSDVVLFDQETSNEFIVLTDPRLTCTVSDQDDLEYQIPQHKITQYFLTDVSGHGVSLEDGLIESGQQVFLHGLVMDITSSDDMKMIGIAGHRLGPIIEWWFSGFDGSKKVIVGIETELASYLLSGDPHDKYHTFISPLMDKILLCKLVIEFLSDSPDASYAELLEEIRMRSKNFFDEESVICHSKFIMQQIYSYDDAASQHDLLISSTTAFQELIDFCGRDKTYQILKDPKHLHSLFRKDIRKISNSDTAAVVTPLVKEFFDNLLPITSGVTPNRSRLRQSSLHEFKERPKHEDKVVWIERVAGQDQLPNKTSYHSMKINGIRFAVKDLISFCEGMSRQVSYGQILCLTEDKKSKEKQLHIQRLLTPSQTILSTTASSTHNQLYLVDEYVHINPELVIEHISVSRGKSEKLQILAKDSQMRSFKCTMKYDKRTASFQEIGTPLINHAKGCSCFPAQKDENMNFKTDDFVLIKPEDIDIKDNLREFYQKLVDEKRGEEYDDEIFTERYRKEFSEKTTGSLIGLLKLYHVGQILSVDQNVDQHEASIHVRIFLRPENVFYHEEVIKAFEERELLWSQRIEVLKMNSLVRKCSVSFSQTLSQQHDFFIRRELDPLTLETRSLTHVVAQAGNSCVNNNLKDAVPKKLSCLDLFSGCGGLSLGFKEVLDTKWAVEKDPAAAKAFKTNFPQTSIFNMDANHLLDNLLMNKSPRDFAVVGQVDVILAGPPCQGFSEMNRFKDSIYSKFKNSLVATTLSFVDLYRPKYFIMENVKNFVKCGNSLIFKLTLSCLVTMGYQVRFFALQSGNHGVPQSRCRAFIVAAAVGHKLPSVPQGTHAFPSRLIPESIVIDDIRYFFRSEEKTPNHYALYRPITVYDAIADLSGKTCDNPDEVIPLFSKKRSLSSSSLNYVTDHTSRKLSHLNHLRVSHIPLEGDWRDLPNVETSFKDSEGKEVSVKKLIYSFPEGKTGRLKGVCHCESTGNCESTGKRRNACQAEKVKQSENTLIPWYLVHTGSRNYHWTGVFGRIGWRHYFSTTVTLPDPSSSQGRVIHPTEHRVLSIRECARSQGFPDSFTFCGKINDRYRQVR